MKTLAIVLLLSISAVAQQRQSFNAQQPVLWKFVGAVGDTSEETGSLKCSADARPSCAAVVAAWNKWVLASKTLYTRIASLDALIKSIASGSTSPKTGCSDWDCGDSIALLSKLNTAREDLNGARREYIRGVIQASAKDDGLADFLSSQFLK